MSRLSFVGRAAGLSCCVALFACLPGCLIPYAYPSFSRVPAIQVGKDCEQTYAFRVDDTRKQIDLDFMTGGGTERDQLTPIAMSGDATPAQSRVSVSHGLLVLGVALNYPTLTSHSVAVRLYRPGYKLIEFKAGESVDAIVWKAAGDLAAQEKALDDLYTYGTGVFWLEAGSASESHRQALLFGVSEYDRLAALTQAQGPTCEVAAARLAGKAQMLKALADQ
jgi:hypothetical protein